jgi:microcin C transport system substrate-binding protein
MNKLLTAAAALLVLGGCARKQQEAARDIRPEVTAFYRTHPKLVTFATDADLPKDLVWHDGAGVPEFADPAAKQGGTLDYFIEDFPRTLRFYGPDSLGSFRGYILDYVAVPLIGRQPDTGQYFPALAKQWAFGKDGRTMYFRLDPDARYSDGTTVTADDYLFTFFFSLCPYVDDPEMLNYFKQRFTNITKYDDDTISITFWKAKPDLADQLGSFLPIPEHFYRQLGPDYPQRYQWRLEPTTGAYTIKPEDIHRGVAIDLTRVPNWWANNKPFFRHTENFDRIHLEVIRDLNKAVEAFKRGDIDFYSLNRSVLWYDKVANSDPLVRNGYIDKVTFYNRVPQPDFGFYINTAMPLLDNRNIRRGIGYASDFALVCKEYFRGDWVRMQTSSDGFPEVPFPGIHPRPFSISKALACFAQAGFAKRGPDGILVNAQGQRLSFTVTTPYQVMRDPLIILREQAAKAGLDLEIEVLDVTTAEKKIEEKHDQIAFMAFNVPASRYPDYWQLFDSINANKPQTNNITNTDDPDLDRLIAAYDRATTMDQIRKLAYQIELRIRYDAAFIPAFEEPFFRVGYWRWLKFPKSFSTRQTSNSPDNLIADGLFWIDENAKRETLAARASGKTFPPVIRTYDVWK